MEFRFEVDKLKGHLYNGYHDHDSYRNTVLLELELTGSTKLTLDEVTKLIKELEICKSLLEREQ